MPSVDPSSIIMTSWGSADWVGVRIDRLFDEGQDVLGWDDDGYRHRAFAFAEPRDRAVEAAARNGILFRRSSKKSE